MRLLLATALLAVATPVLADTTAGTVFTYDARSNVLVMEDRTVWQLGQNTLLPEVLNPGDKVVIEFTSAGDDGIVSVDSVANQPEKGA